SVPVAAGMRSAPRSMVTVPTAIRKRPAACCAPAVPVSASNRTSSEARNAPRWSFEFIAHLYRRKLAGERVEIDVGPVAQYRGFAAQRQSVGNQVGHRQIRDIQAVAARLAKQDVRGFVVAARIGI